MKKNFTLIAVFLFALFLTVPDRLTAQVNCTAPADLAATNISPNGAVLSMGTATNTGVYNIRYHGPNSTTWITHNNVSMPFQLGNLHCSTVYEWQGQQVCGTTPNGAVVLSDWSVGASFTTANCPTTTCPVPTYLSTTNITQNGAVLNLGTLANSGTFNIRYRVPNAANYVVINNVTMPFQLGNLTCQTAYEWQAQKICADAAGTTGALSEWSPAAVFTTTNCSEPTPCPVPTNLTASNISQTGAVLHFGNTATSGRYNIRYHGPNSTTWINVNNVTMPFQLGNLTCHTTYEWQAQQICTITGAQNYNFSDWSAGAAFTTSACPTVTCPVPTYLATTNITQTGALLYVSGATGVYNIRYRVPNSTNWITVNNVTIPFQLGNLTCHTAYEWQVQKVCANADNSAAVLSEWSTAVAFTTANCPEQTCSVPTNLTASNITQTGAVLHFGTTTSTAVYNIRYHGPNSVNWITVNNVTMPYQLGNLTCGTVYEWQAQQVCTITPGTAPVLSAWSTGATFTTLGCPVPVCPVPTNLTATNIGPNGAVLYAGTTTTATGMYNIRYHGLNSTTWIMLNNVTIPFQLRELMCNTAYVWQAQKICGAASNTEMILSDWSAEASFTTTNCPVPTCPVPTNLAAANISQTGAVLHLGTSTTDGRFNIRYRASNSTALIEINNVTMPFQLGGLTCHTIYECQVQRVCANTVGTTPVLSDWSAGITFTTLECPATCPVPTYLSTTNITQTGAVLNLGSIANTGTFNIRYHGPNSVSWIAINNVTMPYQLRELTCHTTYEWQAQKVCATTDNSTSALSDWSAGVTFTTANCTSDACPVPTNLMATNITETGAVLHFGTTTTAGRYNIRFHGADSANWITINNVTMPFQLGNLRCHAAYEWQAQQICAVTPGTAPVLSTWSAGATFTTANCPENACPIPTNLAATHIGERGAVLQWNAIAGVTAYVVQYKPANSTLPFTTVRSTTNFVQIGGLTAGTVYVWHVTAVCQNGAIASWSPRAMFSTRSSLMAYPNPANQSTSITYWSEKRATVDVKLLDLYGKEVILQQREAVEGNNVFGINTSGVADGLYMIGVYSDGNLTTTKVVIKH